MNYPRPYVNFQYRGGQWVLKVPDMLCRSLNHQLVLHWVTRAPSSSVMQVCFWGLIFSFLYFYFTQSIYSCFFNYLLLCNY